MTTYSKTLIQESPIRVKTIVGVAVVVFVFLMPFSLYNFFQEKYILGTGSLSVVLLMAINAWNCWHGRYYPFLILVGLAPVSYTHLTLPTKRIV